MDESNEVPRTWSAGIVNHGAFDDLEACLRSIESQTLAPRAVAIWDTGEDPAALAKIAASHPRVRIKGGTNEGYAGGANRVISELLGPYVEQRPEFVLLLNPDVVLDADFAERLLAGVADAKAIAIATGKLLRPGRQRIDSAGIAFPSHRRPRDRGSERPDEGQFDTSEDVEGASGAAMLLRASAVPDLAIEGDLFDESFFAYHEDTDLCWRARRLGHRIRYEPSAVAVHARGWRRDERMRVPVEIRRHSFKNHYLQLVKNETRMGLVRNAPAIFAWEFLRIGFVLLRDRGLFPAYAQAVRAMPAAWNKRRVIASRARELDATRACEARKGS